MDLTELRGRAADLYASTGALPYFAPTAAVEEAAAADGVSRIEALTDPRFQAVGVVFVLYLGWLAVQQAKRASAVYPATRPDSLRRYSQGDIGVRVQGGRVRERRCTAQWWDDKGRLILRVNRSGVRVLALPWNTVTGCCLELCEDVETTKPATLLLQCRPTEMLQTSEEKPMLVKLYLTDNSDAECLRSCLKNIDGLSKHQRLLSLLGHAWSMRWGYHRFVTPSFLCALSQLLLNIIGICTKLVLAAKIMKGLGRVEGWKAWGVSSLCSLLFSPIVSYAHLACLGVLALAVVFWSIASSLCAFVLVLAGNCALEQLIALGSWWSAQLDAHPTLVLLESLLLLSHPAREVIKNIPGWLQDADKVYTFNPCHPDTKTVLKPLSVVARAHRYHGNSFPYVFWGLLWCYRDKTMWELMFDKAPDAGESARRRYFKKLNELITETEATVPQGGVFSKWFWSFWLLGSGPSSSDHKADMLISYLEAHKFDGWGDVLSSACSRPLQDAHPRPPSHYVLEWVLRHKASRREMEVAIHAAAQHGHIKVLTKLHEHLATTGDPALPVKGEDNRTILHTAALYGKTDAVVKIYEDGVAKKEESSTKKTVFGVEANACMSGGLTALHCASLATQLGNTEAANLLLGQEQATRATLAAQTAEDGRTAMHCAAAGGNTTLIELLANCSSDIRGATSPLLQRTIDGRTPLHCAAENGKHKAVATMLELLKDSPGTRAELLKAKTTRGWTSLHACALAAEGGASTAELLLRKGADPNAITKDEDTALALAIDGGNATLAKFLVQEATEKDRAKTDSHGLTLLHRVTSEECREALGVHTLKLTAALTNDGRSVLHCAAEKGLWKVYSIFKEDLSKRGVRDEPAYDGLTCLHFAAQGGHVFMVSKLTASDKTEDYKAASKRGDTPLHLAAREGHDSVVPALVETVAGRTAVTVANNAGDTPLHLAAKRGSVVASRELLRAGADVKAQNNAEYTPLHLATNNSVAELLIEEGADVHALGQGRKPLNLASHRGDLPMVELLLREMKKAKAGDDAKAQSAHPPLHDAVKGGHTGIVGILCDWDESAVWQTCGAGRTALHVAAEKGCEEHVNKLCALDEKENRQDGRLPVTSTLDHQGRTPLHYAAWDGHVEVVKLLWKRAGTPAVSDERVVTPLHLAANDGHLKTVEFLLTQTPEASRAQDKDGRTPLHRAARHGWAKTAGSLRDHDGGVCAVKDDDGRTPLHLAAYGGHLETVECLLKQTPETFRLQHKDDCTAKGHAETAKPLREHGGGGRAVEDDDGRTPLHLAAYGGHIKTVKLLLKQAPVASRPVEAKPPEASRIRDKDGSTPLHLAALKGHAETAEFLREHDDDACDMQDADVRTPLHLAAYGGNLETVKVLWKQALGAPHMQDKDGSTPLHLAALKGHAETAKFLREHDNDACDMQDADVRTPLHLAAERGHLETVKALWKRHTQDGFARRCTPLHLAGRGGHLETAKFLAEQDPPTCGVCDNGGRTPLHLAALKGHAETAKFLREHYGDACNMQDDDARTPLHLAAERAHQVTAKVLMK